jgi:hypothetical protein
MPIATTDHASQPPYRNSMCPAGQALQHPAASLLNEWSQLGCPTKTGRPWTKEQMWEAVEQGPHCSALTLDTIAHFAAEVVEKVRTNQARIVQWENIKENPLKELKISPIAAIPHKSKAYPSILDSSFWLHLKSGGVLLAVNDITEKTASSRAIDQIGESLLHIIHAFSEAKEDAKTVMAKWNVKDGFWRMDCENEEEWNFAHVLPQEGVSWSK